MPEFKLPSKYVAKLTSPKGLISVLDFDSLTEAIRWSANAALGTDQRAGIYRNGELVWTKRAAFEPRYTAGITVDEIDA